MPDIVGDNAAAVGDDPGLLLGRLGSLTTRLARDSKEVEAAQRVRHRIFCEEFGAISNAKDVEDATEADAHDANCDHLLIIDGSTQTRSEIVGTQRFYLHRPGENGQLFYSQDEFDVTSLVRRHPDKVFMELGRSCILPEYRSKRTMELMWQGTWAYAVDRRVDVMIGCASFHTSDPSEISEALSFLASSAGVSPEWHVNATGPSVFQIEVHDPETFHAKHVLRSLPPLVKGYLRLGAGFSNCAVIDADFGTVDVLVVLPVDRISERYLKYYGQDASRHRA